MFGAGTRGHPWRSSSAPTEHGVTFTTSRTPLALCSFVGSDGVFRLTMWAVEFLGNNSTQHRPAPR
jgi:hypothetical protein